MGAWAPGPRSCLSWMKFCGESREELLYVAWEEGRVWADNSTSSSNSIVRRPWICCSFSMTLLMDGEHAETEMPQALEGLLKDIRLWIMETGNPYLASFKMSAQLWVLGRKWEYLLPEHTYAYDQAKKAKERKRPGKFPYGGKGRNLDEWEERRDGREEATWCVYPPLLIPVPCSLLFCV